MEEKDGIVMWQKKNPDLEYAIALLRGQKEGIHNGDCKNGGPEEGEPAVERAGSSAQ